MSEDNLTRRPTNRTGKGLTRHEGETRRSPIHMHNIGGRIDRSEAIPQARYLYSSLINMAPRIKRPTSTFCSSPSPELDRKARLKFNDHHALRKVVIQRDSYWDWSGDLKMDRNECAELSVTSDGCSNTVQTGDVSVSSVDANKYWDEVNQDESLDARYFVDYSRILGKGTGTVVRTAIERKTGNVYAVKSAMKYKPHIVQCMKREAKIMSRLDHPSILKVHDQCNDSNTHHTVFERCNGGEVYDRVAHLSRQHKTLGETSASKIVRQLVHAIAHCHARDIVHRDIKMENVLLKNDEHSLEIRLADFGLAVQHSDEQLRLSDCAGTPFYLAPEVLDRSYDRACDVWSIGVFAYALLCGRTPFESENDETMYEKIRDAQLEFSEVVWKSKISHRAKDFIRACLQKDPALRPTAQDLTHHEWFLKCDSVKACTKAEKMPRMARLMRIFRMRR